MEKSNEFDWNKLQAEADRLIGLDEAKAAEEKKNKLFFKEKEISIFRVYSHLGEKLDFFFIIIAILGSIGAGLSMPIMSYLSSDMMSDVGNTSEYRDNPMILIEKVNDAMDTQIKRFLYFGAIIFVCNFLATCFWSIICQRLSYNLKRKYFAIILKQEQGWFDANNAFEFATKVQAQLEQVEMGIGEKLGLIIQSVGQFIVAIIIAFITSWKLTLVMICVAPLILIDLHFLVTSMRTGIIFGRKTWETAGGIAEEMLYNIKTVASFSNFSYEQHRFNEKVEICYLLDKVTVTKLGGCIGLLIFLLNTTFVVALIYGRTLIYKSRNENKDRLFTGGDVMTTSMCTMMAIIGIGLSAPNLKLVQESCTATSDYFTLVERKPQMDYSQSTEKPPRNGVKGLIEFKDVRFYYPSDKNKREILHGLNLRFEPGKKVALVGESGCGKSTTVNLIERLYEATSGEILIDGLEIKKWDVKYLRSLIGYVQQEPVLFNKSIEDNIIFGREQQIKELYKEKNNTTVEDEEKISIFKDKLIQHACEESYAYEFISKLDDQLGYIVGIKGGKLSGGQKQRCAIARAILCDPKILILDEATSALDNISEKEVQRALDNISSKSVTTIIIAHRLSTIKNADLIYAIKEGSVVEQGTHKELLEKNGYYAGLVRSQLAQDEIETKEAAQAEQITSLQKAKTTDLEFKNRTDEIYIKEDDVKVQPCKVIKEVSGENCHNLILAIIGAAVIGIITPINGMCMSHSMNGLLSVYIDTRYHKGLKWALIMLLLSFIQGIAQFIMLWQFFTVGVTLARNYRKKVLRKYLELHISFFDITTNAPGALLTRLSIDTMQLNSLVMSILGTTVQCGCIFILGIILGCYYEYRLCLIMFCFVPFMCIAMVIRRGIMRGSNKWGVKANVEAGGVLSECVVNTKTIYSFNFQEAAVELFFDCLYYVRKQIIRDAIMGGLLIALGNWCLYGGNATVFAASKYYILGGSIDSEDMGLALNITLTSAAGIGNGMGQLGDVKKAVVAFKSLYSTLDMETKIQPFDKENKKMGQKSAENIKGRIELRNVSFAYPTRPEQVILKNVSFTVEPGWQAALVGYSGSGKSTIIQLLTRFYDVEDGMGEILIDGVNIKDYNLFELRKKIGLVSQEPVLFKRSVLENVRYGNLKATDQQCIDAAREANIMKFFTGNKMHRILDNDINKKKSSRHSEHSTNSKEGKDGDKMKKKKSSVGEKEDPVSGGEKQRLAIARAFVKNPVILLLDEATSALDRDSEKEVQKSLDALAKNRTSIAIAHRLSTIEHCNKIFVLENGRKVEEGTHEELMKLKDKYYTLHKYSDLG